VNTLEMLRGKKVEILRIAAKHGASNVRIFGSVVRGEDSAHSDVDMLVDMADNRSLLDLVGFQQEVETLVGRRADVLTENGLSRHLKDRILAEAAPL
jgi:uncharacterized protein